MVTALHFVNTVINLNLMELCTKVHYSQEFMITRFETFNRLNPKLT
jgi:hypothetical protein